MVLSRRLQRWACLWKVDVVFNVLCLLAVWAFLFKGWSNLQVVGGHTPYIHLACPERRGHVARQTWQST